MKTLSVILSAILFFAVFFTTEAQNNAKEYFLGKWNVSVNGPNGKVEMVVGFEKNNDTIIGSINDSDGKELYKVTDTTIGDESVTVNFIGSQGTTPLYLKKRDENHLTGDIMGMFSASGERIKE